MENNNKNTTVPAFNNGSRFGSRFQPESGNRKTFHERVRERRENLGWYQKDLAKKIGVSTATITTYESNQLPKGDLLIKLCNVLQVSADYLLFGAESSNIKTVGFDEFDMVPMAEAKLGAGGGLVVLSERLRDFYAFRKEWLHRIVTSVANAVLMRIQGDSMEPFIRDGDTVMVDQGRIEIATGKIFALGVDDTVLLKRLEKHPAGRIIIKSDNPAYSTYELAPSEIRIIGQVVWSAHEHVRLD